MSKFKVGIVGATGFTGHELIKILAGHGGVELVYATSTSSAGKKVSELYPDLSYLDLSFEDYTVLEAKKRKLDCVFLAVPHGESMQFAFDLLEAGIKVVDLSADFRFSDYQTYEKTYKPHSQRDLCSQAVYGLPEFFRKDIVNAKLIGNPGCYVTASLLALLPLKEVVTDIIIDAKSGVSGAGRKAEEAYMYVNVASNFKAYGIAKHRHQPEIETYVGQKLEFTPHLLPVSRGILATVYFKSQKTYEELNSLLQTTYKNEPFVTVLTKSDPELRMITGTNNAYLKLYKASKEGQFIIVSVIDNLVKGASGQAVQNMNLILGLEETAGLILSPVYP